MRWRGRERSDNVEDRRRMAPAAAVGGGGIGVIVIALIAMFLGADGGTIARILGQAQQQAAPAQQRGQAPSQNDDAAEFIQVVLKDTEEVWTQIFRQHVRGSEYAKPRLVIFNGSVRSGCGIASSEVGPFYCPADQQVYIDPAFFEQLRKRHNAPGDFAQAYVIAHEIGHHVQLLLGFSQQVDQVRRRGNEEETNRASVRLELQADYLAGVWAHHAQKRFNILEEGDIEEAIQAANQIGDDTLQREAMGYVNPQKFTHGRSVQRKRWLSEGLRSGDLQGCQQLFTLAYEDL